MRKIILTVLSILLSLSGKSEVVLKDQSCIAYVPGLGPVLSATVTTTTPGALFMWTTHGGILAGPYSPTSWTGSTALFDLSAMGIDSIGVTCDTFYFHYDSVGSSPDPRAFALLDTICPCDTDSIPVYRPGCLDFVDVHGVMHQIVKVKCNVNAAHSYLWYPAGGTSSIAMQSITYNAIDNDYDVVFDLTAAGFSVTTGCHHFNVNYFNVDPFPANDIFICPCDTNTYPPMPSLDSGCITFDKKGHQIIRLFTNYTGSSLYMWVTGLGPVPQTGGIPGSEADFDLNTFGLGVNITMECHTFYFNTTPTDPTPNNSIVICPCDKDTLIEAEGCSADFTYCQSTANVGNVSLTPVAVPVGSTHHWIYDIVDHNYSTSPVLSLTPGMTHKICHIVDTKQGSCEACIEICVNKPEYPDPTGNTKRKAAPKTSDILGIFPNPTSNTAELKFNLSEDTHVQVEIVNAMGQIVKTIDKANITAGTQSVEFDTTGMPSGVYTVRLKTNKSIISSRLSVIK